MFQIFKSEKFQESFLVISFYKKRMKYFFGSRLNVRSLNWNELYNTYLKMDFVQFLKHVLQSKI